MAKIRENLAGIDSTLTDDNLSVVVPADIGKSILLVGTAGQGPVNNPVVVRSAQDAVSLFGSEGTLVDGLMETFYAPGGAKDIRLMRISNGTIASLYLYEAIGGVDESTPSVDEEGEKVPALKIESLFPGTIYNNVSFRKENMNIIGYNPVTGTETIIPYDPTGQKAGSVSDIKTLANAINVDPNLGSVVRATPNRIHTMFEVDVHADWDYINVVDRVVTIDLIKALTSAYYVKVVDYPVPSGVLPTVSYTDLKLSGDITDGSVSIEIESDDGSLGTIATDWPGTGYIKIYKVTGDEEHDVEIIKYSVVVTTYGDITATLTVDERGIGGTTAISHLKDDVKVTFYIPIFPLPVYETAANRIEELVEVYELANFTVELDAAGKSQLVLPHPAQMEANISKEILKIDGTNDIAGTGEAIHLLRNSFIGTGNGTEKVFSFSTYEAIDATTLKIYRTSKAGATVEILSADYTLTSAGGEFATPTANVAVITFSVAPLDGAILTVAYDSIAFALTQLATFAAAEASTSYREYFIGGDRITFGTAQPADIKFVYPAKIIYKIDQEVIVTGNKQEKIVITPSVREIGVSGGTIIGLDYYYQPEWVDLSAAKSLQLGTDGINMTNIEKYRILGNAYEEISNYPVDMIVLLKTYLDDVKIMYDVETGLPVEVNAGFAEQLSLHLESMLEGVAEAFGVISVKPADSARLVDVNNWYKKLTETSWTDRNRAANVMQSLNARLIDVLAMELVVTNPNATGPYVTTGEAIFAGLSSRLDVASATTNKSLGANILGLRYKMSDRMLNKLTGDRYVTARIRPGRGIVVTDGITAALLGSDWTRRSTFNIVAAAMSAIRSVGDPYLGEGFSSQKQAALTTAINRVLLALQERGAIQSYSFAVEQTPAEAVRGIARIPLVIQPAFELRKISVIVRLSAIAV